MAWKRMFDRGVLDVLAFASHGFYSAVEADTFNDPSQRVSVKQKEEVSAPVPAPAANHVPTPAPSRVPQPRPPERRSIEPAAPAAAPPKKPEAQGDDALIRFITANGFVSKGDICNHMGWEPVSFLSRINPLIDEGVLVRTGQKRGTKYSMAQGGFDSPVPTISPLTQQEYHLIWRDASERLRSLGMSQLVISRIVREVTGHETAIAAHQNGSLTKEAVDKIFALGQEWSASFNNGGGITHGL